MSPENENLDDQNGDITPDLSFDNPDEIVSKATVLPVKDVNYSLTDADGKVINVKFVDDENTFHPTIPNLPTPPSK